MDSKNNSNLYTSAVSVFDESCNRNQSAFHRFEMFFTDGPELIELSPRWKEIFPGIKMKYIFPKSKANDKTILVKAKAGSKIEAHKMLPTRFIYIIKGKHVQENDDVSERGIIINEGQEVNINSLGWSGSYYPVDTELIIQLEDD